MTHNHHNRLDEIIAIAIMVTVFAVLIFMKYLASHG